MSLITWGNGELTITVPNANTTCIATQGREKGCWYFEYSNQTVNAMLGVALDVEGYHKRKGVFIWNINGNLYGVIGDNIVYVGTSLTGTVIGVAIDLDMGTIKFSVNNKWYSSIQLDILNSGVIYPALSSGGSVASATTTVNFGATPFEYELPKGYLPYDIDNAVWVHNIEDISITKTNIWYTDASDIRFKCNINAILPIGIRYTVYINDEEVVPLSEPKTAPTKLDISIPTNTLTLGQNILKLVVVNEAELERTFEYIITKENMDTFTFKRVFDFKEDYITDPNIKVIYEEGLALNNIGEGQVLLEIPTEGKSKLSSIEVEGAEDKLEELTIDEMEYLQDLGEGKVYKGRILTEYITILKIDVV